MYSVWEVSRKVWKTTGLGQNLLLPVVEIKPLDVCSKQSLQI